METWPLWAHGLLLLCYTISRMAYPWALLALARRVANRSDGNVMVKLKKRSVKFTVVPNRTLRSKTKTAALPGRSSKSGKKKRRLP